MVNFFRLLIAIFVIVIYVPQTPTENILLRVLNQTSFFTNYNYVETQTFLNRLNWILIPVFLTITFFAELSYS